MSLLDDVSIVVTPNGYKAGTLYGVLPTATEGSDQVINGDFATDTDWTKAANWTISGGKAISNGSGLIYQTGVTYLDDKQYKVTFNADITSGNFTVRIGNTSSSVAVTQGFNTHYLSRIPSNTTGYLFFQAISGVGSIDNVSVKEWTASDMDVTRATAATRVDENGLVNYAEVLGSELVTCGDFSCADPNAAWTVGAGWNIANGKATASPAADYLSQANVYDHTTVKTYKITYDITVDSGTFQFLILGKTGSGFFGNETTSGTYTVYFTTTGSSGDGRLFIAHQGGFDGDVNSVSVKEADRNNVPRIDYTGGGCPHILAEPQRTNLLPYSEDLSQWNLKQGTETLNYGISPDGTQNSTRIVFSGANLQFSNIFTTVTPTVGSIFIKGVNGETINFGLDSSEAIFTLNGSWQRFEKSGTSTSNKITINTFGGATARDIQVYGGQVEAGTYPTSYIPTSGSAVTRNQDVFSRDGIASLINDSEGVLFAEFSVFDIVTNSKVISLVKSSAPASSSVVLYYNGNRIAFDILNPSGTVSVTTNITNALQLNKVALKYKSGDIALWFNGVEIVTRTNTISLSGLDELQFDYVSGNGFYGKLKQLQVYKTALTDLQIESITSWTSFSEMANALNYTIY